MNHSALFRFQRAHRYAYQALSAFKTPQFRPIRTACPTLPTHVRASVDVETLRVSASEVFQHPEFKRLCWVGVYGDFADGTAEYMSEVDLILIHPRDVDQRTYSTDTPDLDDILLRTWARRVHTTTTYKEDEREFDSYHGLQALFCSRTIYLRDDEARTEVSRLRQLAMEGISKGKVHFSQIVNRIKAVQRTARSISHKEFSELPEKKHRSMLLEICSILDDLVFSPPRKLFRFKTMYLEAMDMRNQLEWFKARAEDREDWKDMFGRTLIRPKLETRQSLSDFLWHILTTSQRDSLESFAEYTEQLMLNRLDKLEVCGNQVEDIFTVTLRPAKGSEKLSY